MAIDPVKVAAAVAGGTSPVCATCKHYWRGQDKGLDRCVKQRHECGGPIRGLDFPLYDGPMTEDRMMTWCFMCAAEASYGVRVKGTHRVFGLCAKHLDRLPRLRPASEPTVVPQSLEVIGAHVSSSDRIIKPRLTLGKAIYEVEKYYADKEGREFT